MSTFKHLVLVDDETDIGEILSDMFVDKFEIITTFSVGPEAFEFIRKTPTVSAIITDINMPNMNGDQLIRKLRAEGLQTPVFFLTGMATKEVILTALRLGVADVFEKPFAIDVVTKGVERVLEIEKRKSDLINQILEGKASPEELHKMKKMLGLLQVVNESQKKAS